MGPLAAKKSTFPMEKVSTNMKLVTVILLAAVTILSVVKLANIREEDRVILEKQDSQLILVKARQLMGL